MKSSFKRLLRYQSPLFYQYYVYDKSVCPAYDSNTLYRVGIPFLNFLIQYEYKKSRENSKRPNSHELILKTPVSGFSVKSASLYTPFHRVSYSFLGISYCYSTLKREKLIEVMEKEAKAEKATLTIPDKTAINREADAIITQENPMRGDIKIIKFFSTLAYDFLSLFEDLYALANTKTFVNLCALDIEGKGSAELSAESRQDVIVCTQVSADQGRGEELPAESEQGRIVST